MVLSPREFRDYEPDKPTLAWNPEHAHMLQHLDKTLLHTNRFLSMTMRDRVWFASYRALLTLCRPGFPSCMFLYKEDEAVCVRGH